MHKKLLFSLCLALGVFIAASCSNDPSPQSASPVPTPIAKLENGNATPTPTPELQDTSQGATATATATVGSEGDPPETAPTQTAQESISGLVWDDLCETGAPRVEISGPIPSGCVLADGELQANGIVEVGEPGLAGVSIDLGAGPCPAPELETQLSSADGTFSFSGLSPGAYCVSIDSQNPQNAAILLPGSWTSPTSESSSISIDLVADAPSTQVNFGWDFAQQAGADEVGCVEKAAFFEDVTVPDNTVFRPGDVFVKTWRLRNEGTCPWGPDYALIFSHGDQLNGTSSSPLPPVAPGEIINLSADLKAPERGGTYVGNWQLRNPDGQPFGVGINGKDFFWVQIAVSWFPSPDQPPVSPPDSTPPPPPASTSCEVSFDISYESEVLSLLNAARASQNLLPLTQQDQLTAAARAHSTDMACNDFIDHTGSDGSTWFDRVSAQGYTYAYASENIYVGDPAFGGTPQGAVEWWMNSQVHRDNILYPDVSEIGVGYVFRPGSTYGGYYTLVFAKP